MTLEVVQVKEPLTPAEDEKVIVVFSGATIFIGVAKKDAHVGEKAGFMMREAYAIVITNTLLPSKVQGGPPKLAANISITAPPAASLDPDVKTTKLWVGQMAWAYTPNDKTVETVRGALKNQAAALASN